MSSKTGVKKSSPEQKIEESTGKDKSLPPIRFFPVKEEDWVKIFPHFK